MRARRLDGPGSSFDAKLACRNLQFVGCLSPLDYADCTRVVSGADAGVTHDEIGCMVRARTPADVEACGDLFPCDVKQ